MKKLLSITCLVFIASNVQAKLYKCKDQYGRTGFQDKPCVTKNTSQKSAPMTNENTAKSAVKPGVVGQVNKNPE